MVRPIIVVTGRQRPHELLLLVVSLAWGVAYLLGSPAPGSIAALMPQWEIWVWAGGLATSGVAGLAGCWWRTNFGRALGLEMGGMLIGAAATMLYGVAVLVAAGARGGFAAAVAAAWTGANLWRAGQIRRDLSTLDAVAAVEH